jgi:glutathione S-transferase
LQEAAVELIIGPRTYSTWSLRGWLVMHATGAPFTTRSVAYATEADKAALLQVSPSGRVPLLKVDGETIWDTLSIAEWAAERFPEAQLWPADPTARAQARSITAEMHAGFGAVRDLMGTGPDHPMVGPSRAETPSDPALARELRRLVEIFRSTRARFGAGGDYLFGRWTIADAFYTPVAARFRHFQVDPARFGDADGVAAAYVAALLASPGFQEWEEAAAAEISG